MDITITQLMIDKLSHAINEIRVRALRNLERKITSSLASDCEITFNGADLIRALLRWFSQDPLVEEGMVLNVIFLVLNSKYGPEIINYLTKNFLRGELSAVRVKLKDEEHCNILDDIECVIEQIQEVNLPVIDLTDDLPIDNLNISDKPQLTPREYVKCWSTPTMPDLQSLKLMRESLLSGNDESTAHAMEFLSISLDDYPAEWMLQPPYIIVTLQEHLTSGEDVREIFPKYNKLLIERIPQRECSALYTPDEDIDGATQMSVSKYCRDTFEIVNTLLRGTQDQATINWCFDMFTQLVHLLTIDANKLPSVAQFILRELGNMAKFYRKCLGYKIQDFTARKLYIRTLQLILRLKDDVEDTSHHELSVARLDVAIKSCYPDIYSAIETICPGDEVSVLLTCENFLRPAVTLLRPLGDIADEEVIVLGVEALKTSNLHRSTQLAERLLNAIVNCLHMFPGNDELRKAGEWIVLKLLANPCVEIQRYAYAAAAEKMKHFMASLVNGEQLLGGRVTTSTFRNLGIPLTREILTEVVTFGCNSTDPAIHSSATTILLFILRSRVILKKQWMLLGEIIFPILPLLQCWITKTQPLGEAIMSLLHPDNDIITPLDAVQTSVRLLYNKDPMVRDEAISWILYILNCLPKSSEFLPNISTIADTVPNDIVFLDYQIDTGARFRENSSEAAAVANLLSILESEGVEPGVRKTTLMQLNLLAMDPKVNEILSDGQGWVAVLRVLDTCFKVSQTQDYLDVCIPAIGIFSKILLHSQDLRQHLSDEINVYFILLRGLLLFNQDTNFRADASIALFLLAFADYTIGVYTISLPQLMKKIYVPFLGDFHWNISPHCFLSELNEIFSENPSSRHTTPRSTNCLNVSWQFIRLSFANLWFSGLENVIVNARNSKREHEHCERLNYSHIPQGKEIKAIVPLEFSENLKMTKRDLLLIHSSLPMDSFRYFIHQIENATTHEDVAIAMAHIYCNLSLDPKKKFPMESLVGIVKKFCLTPPTTPDDCDLFLKTLQLLRTILEHDDGKALEWLVEQIVKKKSAFLSILQNPGSSMLVLTETTWLIKKVVEHIYKKVPKDHERCLGIILTSVMKALENCFEDGQKKTDMGRGRILMDLMAYTSDIVNLEEDSAARMLNRILLLSSSTKSLCQAGSKFIVSCLVGLRGFMGLVKDVHLKSKYMRHISGLCSHTDIWVRLSAWMCLCRMAEGFASATMLIEELKYLPGGFHACCIGTVLDNHECGFIRHVAACTFANLLSHRISHGIAPQVAPQCSESLNEDTVEDIVMLIVKKHNVAGAIAKDLVHFYIWDVVTEDATEVISPMAVNGFCILLRAIIEIRPAYIGVLIDENCLQMLTNILAAVPTNTTDHVLQMSKSLCSLLVVCLQANGEIIIDDAAVGAVLHLQNVAEDKVFIKILTNLGTTSIGYNVVTTLARDSVNVFSLVVKGLLIDAQIDLQLAALEFLAIYLQMELRQKDGNFLSLIDPLPDQENEQQATPAKEFPVTLLFRKLGKLFQATCAADKPAVASFLGGGAKKATAKAIGLLLRCSTTARRIAQETNFFAFLMKRLDATATAIGTSCADYVRRYGEVKKKPIVEELTMMLEILCEWFAVDMLEKDEDAIAICRLLQRLWSWSGCNAYLERIFLMLLVNLSEYSHPFCRHASTDGILELMLKKVAKEMGKMKQEQIFRITMRFLTNCCSCIEGRIVLMRQGALEHISQLHPSVMRRPQNDIIEEWLGFYEILSRYPEGRATKHITVLTALIAHKNAAVRHKAVEILRNFAVDDANTAALLSSDDFMKTIKLILDDADAEDQKNVADAIWSMVANNQRAKNAIKGTSIPTKLQRIQDRLNLTGQTEGNLLYTALENISNILSA